MTPAETRARLLSPGEWGKHGSSDKGPRYARPMAKATRTTCRCCGQPETHVGCANGVALFWGCRWIVGRWVRDPRAVTAQLWQEELARVKGRRRNYSRAPEPMPCPGSPQRARMRDDGA